MSTKIYNGIKFKSNKLGEVIRQLHGLKEESVKRVTETFESDDYFNFRWMVYQYRQLIENGVDVNHYITFGSKLQNELDKENTLFAFRFGVTIFEREDVLYGIFYDETGLNNDDIFKKGIAVDYHYQDQTDKPDDISDQEWSVREKVWSDIFEDISVCWVPSEAGVVYDIVTATDIHISKEIFENVCKRAEELNKEKE